MAKMSALELAREFCKRQGLPEPASVVNAQDDNGRQIHGLMNEGVSELSSRYRWQELVTKKQFNHAGGVGYLAFDFIGLPDYLGFIPETLWDVTGRERVTGPLTVSEWVSMTTMLVSQASYAFRMQANALYIFGVPNPLSSVTFEFSYHSMYGVYDSVGAAYTERYTKDTDICRLPDRIALADLKWRWRAAKGLPYAEDQRMCEGMILDAVGREPLGPLSLDEEAPTAGPGLLVAAGNWPL